ncbi:MAG: N-acetylmuramoyl-L-alanine amidase, partial [Betaproteobacteria bacterium]
MNRGLRATAALLATLLLAACATPPPGMGTTEGGIPVVTTHTAKGQDSRALFLVIHYTVADLPQSLHILTEREVSAHYLLTDETPPRIFRLVDENRRAWHSGVSGWKGHRLLNASSIGIEIVHPGFRKGPDGARQYLPFGDAQIDALVPLVRDIVTRHRIRPERVLGHGEVTPAYKEDPGPTFPWHRLAAEGLVPPLPDAARVAAQRAVYEAALPDAAWFQQQLRQWGYVIETTGQWDEQSRRVMMNFQMRYRPADHRAEMDAESAALLWVLNNPQAAAPAAPPALPAPR